VRPLTVLLAAALLAGCGGARPAVTAAAASQLAAPIDALRRAAIADDPAGASAALAGLRVEVVRLRSAGQISAERAARVLADAADVEAQLASLPAPTTTTTSTSTTVAPPPPTAPRHDRPKGHGGDH
jgi:hypothetical protein